MNATIAERDPALTPPPRPSRPSRPSFPPSEGDRKRALAWIMGGAVADEVAGHFARTPASFTPQALFPVTGDEGVARSVAEILGPVAGEIEAGRVRLVEAMRGLEAEGWTPETAAAAPGMPVPQKAAA